MDIKRWINISLRSLHLTGLLGVAAPILFSVDHDQALPWIVLTVLSGLGLLTISIVSNRVFLIQLRGNVILLKLILLSLIPFYEQYALALLICVTLLSGFIAHAPGNIRYYSIIHGKRIGD